MRSKIRSRFRMVTIYEAQDGLDEQLGVFHFSCFAPRNEEVIDEIFRSVRIFSDSYLDAR